MTIYDTTEPFAGGERIACKNATIFNMQSLHIYPPTPANASSYPPRENVPHPSLKPNNRTLDPLLSLYMHCFLYLLRLRDTFRQLTTQA